MNGFQSLMEIYVIPAAAKIARQRHLAAVRDGLAVIIPMTVIGGISCFLAVPPIPASMAESPNLFSSLLLAWKSLAGTYAQILALPYYLTTGILSLYVTAAVACQMAKSYHMDIINNVLSALLVFLCVSNCIDMRTGFLSTDRLGADYMFGAVTVALLVVEINHLFIEKSLFINMPSSVPPSVAAPFHYLLPLGFNVLLWIGGNCVCTYLTGDGITGLVFSIFRPLLKVTDSLPSILLLNAVITTFWFFGIHGTNLVGAVTLPITTAALAANMEAYRTGGRIDYIFAGNVSSIFGNWITYIAILMVIFTTCKSSRLKSAARLAIIPSIFNINEPCIFGIPTVLNLYTYIPLLICNAVNFSSYYLLARAGILGRFSMSLPFTVPGPLAAALATMDPKAFLLWIVLLTADYFIVMPFMKLYDTQLMIAEKHVSSAVNP